MNDNARKARIFLGLAVVPLLFLSKTFVAHHRLPNPASPVVWTVLGLGVLVCLALAALFHARSKSD